MRLHCNSNFAHRGSSKTSRRRRTVLIELEAKLGCEKSLDPRLPGDGNCYPVVLSAYGKLEKRTAAAFEPQKLVQVITDRAPDIEVYLDAGGKLPNASDCVPKLVKEAGTPSLLLSGQYTKIA